MTKYDESFEKNSAADLLRDMPFSEAIQLKSEIEKRIQKLGENVPVSLLENLKFLAKHIAELIATEKTISCVFSNQTGAPFSVRDNTGEYGFEMFETQKDAEDKSEQMLKEGDKCHVGNILDNKIFLMSSFLIDGYSNATFTDADGVQTKLYAEDFFDPAENHLGGIEVNPEAAAAAIYYAQELPKLNKAETQQACDSFYENLKQAKLFLPMEPVLFGIKQGAPNYTPVLEKAFVNNGKPVEAIPLYTDIARLAAKYPLEQYAVIGGDIASILNNYRYPLVIIRPGLFEIAIASETFLADECGISL